MLRQENEKFNETLEQGLGILDRVIEENPGETISGDIAFKLYDTYGFPADLTADVAREHGVRIDMEGFAEQMERQRTRARAASRFVQGEAIRTRSGEPTEFVGYDALDFRAEIKEILVNEQDSDRISESESGLLILDRTPFYAESGGQVGDKGVITTETGSFEVLDTRYLTGKAIGHLGRLKTGSIAIGQQARAQVAGRERQFCANNHSATHLLHSALKEVLGTHVDQKGSLVEPRRLRFDFSHYESISSGQLNRIELLVNENIRANHEVSIRIMDLDQATKAGAAALFGEKYDDRVRTIRMGEFSFELCGGTHVKRTGDIGFFKIVSESAIAAGVRRIEALTGQAAETHAFEQSALIQELSGMLKSSPDKLAERIRSMHDTNRQQLRQIQELQAQLAGGGSGQTVHDIRGTKVVTIRMDDSEVKSMRMAVDRWKNRLGSGVAVVGGVAEGKVTLIAGVSQDLTDRIRACDLVSDIAARVGGKGGGRPDMAQGGGPDAECLDDALEQVHVWVDGHIPAADR
ncbi:MAG: alanine--tRNA ligase [Gammaproteobacteria bacterium]|nr:alanine--tRNA ligase [Gammaproteobacteria bacterium]